MSKVILVTGPAKSGKSEWAETLATQTGKSVVYIATAIVDANDAEWLSRITLHRQRRPETWVTWEVPVQLVDAITAPQNDCLLIDSLGTWVANLLEEDNNNWENILQNFCSALSSVEKDIILVAEETGWGIVPAYPLGRLFRDRLGNLVRQIAAIADVVYLVTGGYVLNLTALGSPLPPYKH
ncbi:bifunctional adenosylcobinamide kinase/adenosylcobinamide-phosphate guanylyltransferase [Chroococcidiopsis sp. TS-821]|uniref:bifunctional adenosylcobinamide kinase/adenosylcobinamide-phosphate guanylyltransferase n=1 Tax=Chroococcidiopsis sp. TS-821 TaxID=1378066 RepID=UPI000CEE2C16|nr:bifunctional adenosylcobinamide kinase/adenosylcobinamide-phosphate guanylyltransferase [Chroococcidiopsis sp. TS-821]PPS45666.1 bifunctional adenosylcobinamide kinase/adenosylcobinamide-phosphate guanylyltransferase [Chroococcidiopsis sp. TS-821]